MLLYYLRQADRVPMADAWVASGCGSGFYHQAFQGWQQQLRCIR
jgi:hypothetical protein